MNLDVPDAIWFSSVFPGLQEIPAGKYSPSEIRRWFNKQQKALAAAAMWFCSFSATDAEIPQGLTQDFPGDWEKIPAGLSYPTSIRKWHREQQALAAAALWFATEFRTPYENLPADLTHPKHIRVWFNEQQATAADALWFATEFPMASEKLMPAVLSYPKEIKEERGGLLFSVWVQEMFPGIGKDNITSSMWFAENFSGLPKNLPADKHSPDEIRRWFNEQQAPAAAAADLPEELKDAPAPANFCRNFV